MITDFLKKLYNPQTKNGATTKISKLGKITENSANMDDCISQTK